VGVLSRSIRDTLVKNLGNFCPDNANLEELTGVNVEAEAQTAVDLLQQLDDFVTNDLSEVREGVSSAQDVTKMIDDGVETIDVSDWQSLIILIPWVLVPSFMLVGVLMAWCDVTVPIYDCILQWFLLPLLVIMTISSMVLASAISVAAVGNAGTCSAMCCIVLCGFGSLAGIACLFTIYTTMVLVLCACSTSLYATVRLR
jgi:hypothetical protein